MCVDPGHGMRRTHSLSSSSTKADQVMQIQLTRAYARAQPGVDQPQQSTLKQSRQGFF